MNEHIRAGLVDYANLGREEEEARHQEEQEKDLTKEAKLREVEQIMDTR